jgi:hypothetical protein
MGLMFSSTGCASVCSSPTVDHAAQLHAWCTTYLTNRLVIMCSIGEIITHFHRCCSVMLVYASLETGVSVLLAYLHPCQICRKKDLDFIWSL